MDKEDELLEENSIEDLLDEDTPLQETEGESTILTPELETTSPNTLSEEEVLDSELEFGEDPEYDDSIDDYDQDSEKYEM